MKVGQLILAAAAAVTVAPTGHSTPVWTTRFVVAPSGNEVRYRVREQLAGFDLPNDAVGRSARISGAIAFDADGRLLRRSARVPTHFTSPYRSFTVRGPGNAKASASPTRGFAGPR